MSFEYFSRSETGPVRVHNEDACYVTTFGDGLLLALVADGVGGNNAGEVASAMVVEEFQKLVAEGKLDPAARRDLRSALLDTAIHKVHGAIGRRGREDKALNGMATTLTLILTDAETGILAQVGDSRCYRFRDGEVTQLSVDQTVAEELVQAGKLERSALATHPDRGTLSQCLGLEGIEHPLEVVFTQFELKNGDQLLLCSDGLSDVLQAEAIEQAFKKGVGGAELLEELVRIAYDAAADDNVTLIVVGVGSDLEP